MTEIARALATFPIPLILLLALGVLIGRSQFLGRLFVTLATVMLIAVCLPSVGRMLERPLIGSAPIFDPESEAGDAAILVPTGGIYPDAAGTWWPASESVLRTAVGRKLRATTGLSLLLIGGRPRGETVSEAMVVARAMDLVDGNGTPVPGVFLETAAENSVETAAAAKPILDQLGVQHVVLITSPTHTARMSASLRHLGYQVSVHIDHDTPKLVEPLGAHEPFVPSLGGLLRSSRAVHEYVGIVWYLLNGYFTVSDLRQGAPVERAGEAE